MLFMNEDQKTYTGGPLDLIGIMFDTTTGRYHCAFWEERPMPGPRVPITELTVVRLKSKMHHTAGSDTFEDAVIEAKKLADTVKLAPENIWLTKDRVIDVDGDFVTVLCLPNWRRNS